MQTLRQAPFREQRFAVVDIESTGIDPARDRILEVAVVHVELGRAPVLALDTLVNPERSVSWTELHGLHDWDVADAPTFAEVASHVHEALSERVVVSHNAEFDLGMLGASLSRAGTLLDVPPHVCTLRLAKAFCKASSYALGPLCEATGVHHGEEHSARGDALAAAELFSRFVDAIESVGLRSPADLVAHGTRNRIHLPFLRSFDREAWRASGLAASPPRTLPRDGVGRTYAGHLALRRYRDEVLGAVHDLDVTDDELDRVRAVRGELRLSEAQAHAMHARVFCEYLGRFVDDDVVTEDERASLSRLARCLRRLGWAPGDAVPTQG